MHSLLLANKEFEKCDLKINFIKKTNTWCVRVSQNIGIDKDIKSYDKISTTKDKLDKYM